MQYTQKAAQMGVLVAGGFLAATAVLTGLIPTPMFERYVPRSATDLLFLLSTSLLVGVYAVQNCTRVDCSRSLPAYASGLGGYFAVSCPYCLPVIDGTIRVSAIAASLVPSRPFVGIASLAVLGGVIALRQRRLVTEGPAIPDTDLRCPTCATVLREATGEPEPEHTNGRLRIDVACPECETALAVFIEAVAGDGIAVRKRVVRANDDREGRPPSTPYSLLPSDGDD